ncbi:MAG: hypothetical protein J7K96_07015 [Desulfobacteraceae bacterium]|nr:hypothetical protein [Desulfobacteraceae bacterium]
MGVTVWNSAKSRLETMDVEFTDKNTTWFEDEDGNQVVRMITDIDGGLLISEHSYDYPVFIIDKTRQDINYSTQKALELKELYLPD